MDPILTAHWCTPPKPLARAVGHTLVDFQMIQPGDRILIGLSGGKDSLTLLHVLRHIQRRAPLPFEFAAVTVDPMTESYRPDPLGPYLKALGVPWIVMSEPIVELAERHMGNDSFCAFCARMKRGLLYKACRDNGYNVLALGQHLDDLAESFLMSAFHQGRLETMKAHYRIDAGDLRVIRPLAQVRERQTRAFAEAHALPVISENCPACFAAPTERFRVKQLLAEQERLFPRLFKSLQKALLPLMREGLSEAARNDQALPAVACETSETPTDIAPDHAGSAAPSPD